MRIFKNISPETYTDDTEVTASTTIRFGCKNCVYGQESTVPAISGIGIEMPVEYPIHAERTLEIRLGNRTLTLIEDLVTITDDSCNGLSCPFVEEVTEAAKSYQQNPEVLQAQVEGLLPPQVTTEE